MMKHLLRLSTMCMLLMLAMVSKADGFKDFSVIVNNQEGTLLTSEELVQGTAINFGVAVAADGTVSRVAADDAGAVATVSGSYHSDHGCTGLTVVVPNATNVKITVGQCTYSTSDITVKDGAGKEVVAKTPSNPACWKNDRNNVNVLYYTGEATTLTISGMSYCPFVAVSALTEDEIAALNATYTLTYYNIDGTVIGTTAVKGQDPIGEFKYDAADVTVPDGYAFRGWFTTAEGGKKYKTTDKVEGEMQLYAVVTPIEVPSITASYFYNLADANFDPADHECIEIVGDKAYWHDASHGWALYDGEQINLKVGGDATIAIVNCQYGSGTAIVVKNAAGETIGSLPGKSDSDAGNATFEYTGEATTLSLVMVATGEMYLHSVAIANHGKAEEIADVTGTWDYADTDVMAATMAFSGSSESGEVEAIEKNGLKMIVEANGASFRNNGNNIQVAKGAIFKIPVKNEGDIVYIKGYPGYSTYSISGVNELFMNTNDNPVTEYKATATDAEQGYVAINSEDNNNYYLALSVVQKAPKELATLDNEPATATFAFNAGIEGQQADFGEASPYFVTSKVTYGSNLTIYGARQNQTQFMPLTQQNEGDNATAADESNAIRFLIQPNYGLTFTPKKVSLKTTRFGTDNGLLDFSWENPDKTTVSLAIGVKPERNNDVSNLSYDITGATPAEGVCGLLINLYHLQNGKQIGFGDIVIEGTLSGTEKDVPVLATLTINGIEFSREKVFGDTYEAEMELSKKETMVGDNNPVTATAKKGEIGTITYQGDDTQCVVTIPMTEGETAVEYVLTVVQKPDFKLTYIDTDKQTVLGEFAREKDETIGEFDIDYATATAAEGMKVRGWFIKTAGGEKYTTDYVLTDDIRLYAVATEIEEVSTYKKYIYDLTDPLFDPADHEAFNPQGEGFYWHDSQHGWAFKDGNKIDLLVGPKATVSVTLCRYGSANDIVITDAAGNTLGTIPGVNSENVDGETVAFNYEGEGGTITLNLSTSGEMYIHGVKIVNTAESNYEKQGNWYIVKAGDGESFMEVLEVVNGTNTDRDAERAIIFLPDGVYDLNETVKTAISGHNISIVGQSMDNTIIVTAPDKSIEGLGSADMLSISGTNLYLQDLTLKNALDYYGALSGGGSAGRAAVMQDAGNRTIGKNVRMLSCQDTYYSSNNNMQSYWETCDIHGTVDFICGGGDVRFQNTTISLEPRQLDLNGSRTVTAPTTNTTFGYVFDNCKIVDLAQGHGSWNLGRTWQNSPICVWLNTTLDVYSKNTIVTKRWIEKGMNNTDPKLFGEYNTMDENGQDITPESNIINSHGGDFETILSAEQAANFSYDMMFKDNIEKPWDPAQLAKLLEAPADAKYDNGTVTFGIADNGMYGCALFKNGEIVGISTSGTFNITVNPATDELTIRTFTKMGGLGPEGHVAGTASGTTVGIERSIVNNQLSTDKIYNLQGQRVNKTAKGLYIVNGKKTVIR